MKKRIIEKRTARAAAFPPDEEWDFRFLPPKTDILTVIEYEFLRSSRLNQVIQDWHSRDFSQTNMATNFVVGSAGLLREADLISFSDRSSLGRYCQALEDPESVGFEETDALLEKALRQRIKVRRCTVRQAIGRIFEKVGHPAAVEMALLRLQKDLPLVLTNYHAEKIAMRFDAFPKPWIKMAAEESDEYIRKRCQEFVCPDAPVVLEVVHEIHSTGTVGVEPLHRQHSFVIDWSRTPKEICSAFHTWVNQGHPAGRAGARVAEGWLRKLAAYRITSLGGLTYENAIESLREYRDKRPGGRWDILPHSRAETNWSRAIGDVERLLSEDFIGEIRLDFGKLTPIHPPD